ncbi:MAG: DUF6802 family protein, partial [Sciscionella sp.]
DSGRGAWISEGQHDQPSGVPGADPDHADIIAVDSAHGETNFGTATVDTDHDGILDTAVVNSGDATLMYTDIDGDGQADQVTQIDGNGNVEVREHTGEHEWTVSERTDLAAADSTSHTMSDTTSADDHAWGELFANGTANPHGSADGVVRIDAVTGQWISPN